MLPLEMGTFVCIYLQRIRAGEVIKKIDLFSYVLKLTLFLQELWKVALLFQQSLVWFSSSVYIQYGSVLLLASLAVFGLDLRYEMGGFLAQQCSFKAKC